MSQNSLPLPNPGPPSGYQSAYPPPPNYQQAYSSPYGQQQPPLPPPQQSQHAGYGQQSSMGPLPSVHSLHDPRLAGPPAAPGLSYSHSKRLASGTHPAESPAKKKQSKWSADEDAAIIELRGNGMKWEDISRNLPGRSAISCRLRFQNYLERRSEWDEEKKNKLARLYERFKKDMWEKIAKEMALPWRAAEAMHWQIGEVEMANRANVPVFHLAGYSPAQPTPSYSGSQQPISGPGSRSEDSDSPRSVHDPHYHAAESARDVVSRIDPAMRALAEHTHNRRNSDLSSVHDHDDHGHARRSPRPPTGGHDSVANSVVGDRDAVKRYLSPLPRPGETAHDGRSMGNSRGP